ncbi:MAG TPA: 1,2-phenylacetyl-CoA epoxidase subunit PaaC [Gemmatimonadaceae bacterium]|nr:1,2-phenylacetyl-CoA epoxidase subunit PaaC [Gemmatimonadaceae bacterium]
MTGTPGVALVEYLLRLGDDRLVLGHRVSEWCGHGPILEEDIALSNIALDLIGQANLLLGLAGREEGAGRDQDSLAYFRGEREYRNCLLVELPKGDFAFTIVRQFLFDAYDVLLTEALQQQSVHADLAGIAAKAHKEARYHLRHSAEWVIKLGDGTPESHERVQRALDECWRFTGELFLADAVDAAMQQAGIAPDPASLQPRWQQRVEEVVAAATLALPKTGYVQRGGRDGRHTEHLGIMLAEMQSVARAFPGGTW